MELLKEVKSFLEENSQLIKDDDYGDGEYQSEGVTGFFSIGKGSQNREVVQIFHKLNIGDIFTLKDKEEKDYTCTIINITYSLLLKDLSYTFIMDDKKETPYMQLVAQIDAKLIEGRPMQSLIFENDF